jgi:SNF2 family DNA or RNA helicase
MKTQAMEHQKVGEARLLAAPEAFALGAEQGTGKTWMLLNDAEHQFKARRIQALLVIAPRGVHINWVRREIPTHLSVPHAAEFWLSGAGKRHMAKLDKLLREEPGERLVVLTMNVDAVNTDAGFAFAGKFLRRFKAMVVVDESQRIKSPTALRTKRVHRLGELAVSRRIASGTLVANSPLDLFAQYQFLQPNLLGTTSYRAFVAEYSELLPDNHRLVQEIRSRARHANPQIVKRDIMGNPVFRNLDKLQGRMAPHTFRVLKEDCLDLPDKIYQTHYFDLTPAQQRLYNSVRDDMRFERADGEIDTFSALTLINKLRQVTSGFIMVDGEAIELRESGPRLAALKDIVEDAEGQIIVWASFREELRQIAEALKEHGVVQYHGGTKAKDREEAVDAFQRGDARIFVANPAAGGTGLTLTNARTVVYHSCSFSLEERLQSEDRAHRIGTKHNVVYIDLVARDTIDERIAAALQAKAGVAAMLLGGL